MQLLMCLLMAGAMLDKRGRGKWDMVPERWRWQVSYAKLLVIMSTSCSPLAFEQHRTMGRTGALCRRSWSLERLLGNTPPFAFSIASTPAVFLHCAPCFNPASTQLLSSFHPASTQLSAPTCRAQLQVRGSGHPSLEALAPAWG